MLAFDPCPMEQPACFNDRFASPLTQQDFDLLSLRVDVDLDHSLESFSLSNKP